MAQEPHSFWAMFLCQQDDCKVGTIDQSLGKKNNHHRGHGVAQSALKIDFLCALRVLCGSNCCGFFVQL